MADDREWVWSQEQTIPSDTSAGRQLLDALLSELTRQEWGEQDTFGIHLAVEEALVNAIKHGNGGDPAKSVRMVSKVSPSHVRVEITDEGQGFDPAAVPDPTEDENLEAPSGRGLMLMNCFMSHVEFNNVGNHVVMEKARSEE